MLQVKRLNCGSGNIPLQGYTNIDKYYYVGSKNSNLNNKLAESWDKAHPDSPWVYGDAASLELPSDCFDEVIMVHTLEHLSMDDGNLAIREISRVLKPGGFCEIEVPDIVEACKLLTIYPFRPGGDNAKWLRVMGLIYGTTGADGEGQHHLCGYSHEYLKFKMEQHNLKDIEEIEVGKGHGRPEPEYDFRLRGYK